jgi:hypothetical protein
MKYCRLLPGRLMFPYVRYSLLNGLHTCSSPVSGSTVSSPLSYSLPHAQCSDSPVASWGYTLIISLYIMANMSRSLTCERDADDNRQPLLCRGHDWHSLRLHSLKTMLWFLLIISISILLYSEIASSSTSGKVSSRPFLTLFLRVAGAHWIITYYGEQIVFRISTQHSCLPSDLPVWVFVSAPSARLYQAWHSSAYPLPSVFHNTDPVSASCSF